MSDETNAAKAKRARRVTKKYPGSLTRRGKDVWRLRLCVGGGYSSYTIHGTRLDAENYATTKYEELDGDATRAKKGLPGPCTFSELCKQYTENRLAQHPEGTRETYGESIANAQRYFDLQGDPLVRDIRRSDVASFLEWRAKQPRGGKHAKPGTVSAYTVARDRRVLSVLFSYAIEKDFCDANPVRQAKAPKADPRNPEILTDEQMAAFLKAAERHPMLHTYLVLLTETGARSKSEALTLVWDDVDFAGRSLKLVSAPTRRNKSGKTRVVPMTVRLLATLQAHAARFRMLTYDGKRSPYVFHHLTTHRKAIAGERVRSFRAAIETAAKAANLPGDWRTHDLRHRRVTEWLAAGKSPALVQLAMGHANIQTTMGYSSLVAEHLRSLVDDEPGREPGAQARGA